MLSGQERGELVRLSRRATSSQALALRARIVLACAEPGAKNTEIAARLGVTADTVSKWRGRFVAQRLDGLVDEPRPGRPASVAIDRVEQVVVDTLESSPRDATHWSRSRMAAHSGLSPSTVGRIWRDFGLKPHRSETFKLSKDPYFVDKVVDIVGLYRDPPAHAAVFCVDEKTQIQALDRSAPILPMMPGTPERRTHNYLRNGTTSLFAAFNIADGTVVTELRRRHRAVEYKKFLAAIDKATPQNLDVHVVCDNLATHKTPAVKAWLAAHPRFHIHFTPTGASWINQVERWFSYLTTQLLQRGAHRNVQALEADIRAWIRQWNDDPRPFVWTKSAEEILTSLARYPERPPPTGKNRRTKDAGH